MAENAKKKIDWIDKVLEKGRPQTAPIGPAINEQEIAQ